MTHLPTDRPTKKWLQSKEFLNLAETVNVENTVVDEAKVASGSVTL